MTTSSSAGRQRRRVAGLLLPVLALAVAAALLGATPAGGQEGCDPAYGCPTTTTPPPGPPACTLSASAGVAGDVITATVTGAEPGTTVTITFNGQPVASAEAASDGTAVITFQVPELPPGHYEVFAVGAGFSVGCAAGGVLGFDVLAAAVGQPGFGFTGFNVALLLAVAVALVIGGRALLAESRRRRRRRLRRAARARAAAEVADGVLSSR